MYKKILVTSIFFLMYGIYIIIKFPDFFSDDFLVYKYISRYTIFELYDLQDVPFFLNGRPVSFILLQLFLKLVQNPVVIKVIFLLLYSFLVISFYKLMQRLISFNQKALKIKLLLLVLIFYFTNPDNLIMFYWISNSTELFMILFYTLSILFFYIYLDNKKLINIIFSFVFFLLSILSKQTGLHLPFLFLLFLFVYHDSVLKDKIVARVILVEIAIVMIVSIINLLLFKEQTGFLYQNILKKPFSLIGTILYTINPLVGKIAYNFFLQNKIYAYFIIIILILFLSMNLKKINNKYFYLSVIFLLLIFYPRIFAQGGGRLNSIQILWFSVFLYFCLLKLKQRYFIIIIGILLNIISTEVLMHDDWIKEAEGRKKIIKEFINQHSFNNKNKIILCSPFYREIPNEIYYYKNKRMGEEKNIIYGGIKMENYFTMDKVADYIIVNRYKNEIEFSTSEESLLLEFYKDNPASQLISLKKSKIDRFSSHIKIKLKNYDNKTHEYFVYNGEMWKKLQL